MSTIRKQSIISSIIVYFGFALGLFNTFLFTRQGGFTKEQYGLTGTFIAIASIIFSIASFAMPSYINKFFPYYKAHLNDRKNDMITWSLIVPVFGFILVLIPGIAFKHILVDRVFNNSPELLNYYYWIFPFGFGYTLFMVMEAFAWQHRKAVLSNTMREVVFRLFLTILILFTTFHIIKSFDVFIGIYSMLYIFLFLIMLVYFVSKRQLYFNFHISHVTKRFFKKVLALISFIWSGSLVYNIANVIDTIFIAAVLPNGMAAAGIFIFAQNISSLMQAPQRAIISASVGALSTAWKEKDFTTINRIYNRSSINQLLFSSGLFFLIWMNFEDAIITFHIQPAFIQAKWVFFFIGLTRIIDMGTGVNSQIIITSTFWRFEFITGLILLSLTLPLNFELTRYFGILGPALSTLFSLTVYNTIRYFYLLKKFKMQPFNSKTIFTLLLAISMYLITNILFNNFHGFWAMVIRSMFYLAGFIAAAVLFRLSPDILPVWGTIKKRLRLGSEAQ